MSRTARLVLWLMAVGLLVLLAYASRASVGKPDPDVLYRYASAADALVQYGIMAGVMVGIAGGSAALLGLQRPRSWPRALGTAGGVFVFIWISTAFLDHYLHAGREQGLTPSHWEPQHAGAYAANFAVVALVAPFVEEIAYRGLGYSLLERYGRWVAIVVTALLFGLSHGLVEGLPVLTIFGLGLGWLRSRVDSVYPGMLVHALFNAAALVIAVTT